MKNLIKKWAKDPNRNLTKDVIQTTNRYTKRYSTAYVFREMQIKTMRYHYSPIRLTKSSTLTIPNAEDVEQQNPNTLLEEM